MSDMLRSEAILFWGFVAKEQLPPRQAFGWHDDVWEYELARRLGIEPPEKVPSQRRKSDWDEWRALVNTSVAEWGCTFSWYGTEVDKRYFVAVTSSMHIADGPAALSVDANMPIPEQAWTIKLSAFCQMLNIRQESSARLGWKLVARDRAFVELPDIED